MLRTQADLSVVHHTPLRDWLRSEGLLDFSESVQKGKELPDRVQNRILTIRPEAKSVRTSSAVTSTAVIAADPAEQVRASRLTMDGPYPEVFSQVARHLPAAVNEVRGGRMFVGHHRSTMILGEDRYLEANSSAASRWIAPLLAHAPMPLRIDGTVAILYADGAQMFSHWLFDVLPKIEVLRRAGWTEHNVDLFIVNPANANFQQETLRTLGIPKHKLLMAEGLLIEAKTFLLPTRIRIAFKTPPWVRAFIRERFGPSHQLAPDEDTKIYVSRALARGRRVENEEAVRSVLERRGYQSVYAERHSVAEFARLAARARAIVAPHGAGLANVVFAPKRVGVLEMYGAHLIQEGWLLTSGVGGRHFLLPGKDHHRQYPWQSADFEGMPYHKRNIADYYVEIADLEHAINLMEREIQTPSRSWARGWFFRGR